MRKEIALLPRLYDAGGDLSKDWQVEYYYAHPVTGKLTRFRIMTGLSKVRPDLLSIFSEAQKANMQQARYERASKLIKEWSKKLHAGYDPFKEQRAIYIGDLPQSRRRANQKCIADYLAEALKLKNHGRAEGTQKNNRIFTTNFIRWLEANHLESHPIGAITYAHAEHFLSTIITAQQLSNKWRNEHLSFLRAAFKEIGRMYPTKLPVNPFLMCSKMKHTRKKASIYKQNMRDRVRKYLPGYDAQLWLFVQFVYYTGLRPGKELRLLKLKMIDLANGTFRIPAENAKDRTDRTVTLPMQLLKLLKAMKLKKYPEDYYLFTALRKPGPVPIGKAYYMKKWSAFRKRYNIPDDFKVYSFKHTGATEADRAGIDRREIKEQLGHSSLQQTEEYLQDWDNRVSESIQNRFPDF